MKPMRTVSVTDSNLGIDCEPAVQVARKGELAFLRFHIHDAVLRLADTLHENMTEGEKKCPQRSHSLCCECPCAGKHMERVEKVGA